MRTLEKLTINNYKSIRDQALELGALNLFIGGNGSGKSNLISVFRFLREIVTQNLAAYTAKKGGAETLLYFGRKTSKAITLKLEFSEGKRSNAYRIELTPTDDDGLTVSSEIVYYHERDRYSKPYDLLITSHSKESGLKSNSHICARQAMEDLERYRVYHFHDTSDSAAVKLLCDVDDNLFLRSQAENLSAFLYWMQQKHPVNYLNIVSAVRQIAPFFDDFHLQPSRLNDGRIRLEWREKGSDGYFNAHALSDGTLRFICLATLLLQPQLPGIVLLDEPELGLHPAAINLLASLLSSASTKAQVLVATQSVTLVNQFEPNDVWTVEREDHQSVFRHLSQQDMSSWLEDYALGELWEKNLLGARP